MAPGRRIALSGLLLLACCAPPSQLGANPFADAQYGPQKISIHVRNLNFSDATLWAVSPAGRRRLGVVAGKQDAVFSMPWSFPQRLQVEVDLLAGPRCMTESLDVDPGDLLDLQIEGDFARTAGCR